MSDQWSDDHRRSMPDLGARDRATTIKVDRDANREAIPGLQKLVVPDWERLKREINSGELRKKVDEIAAQQNKPKSWADSTTKSIETISKALALGKTLLSSSEGSCKMGVEIINNAPGLDLELYLQSCPPLEKAEGRFECAPDIFLPCTSIASMTSVRRDNALGAANVNGVVYRPSAGSTVMAGYQLVVAWDVPGLGNAHYHVAIEKADGVPKTFLREVVATNRTGVIDTSLTEAGKDCDVAAFASMTGDQIKVWLSRRV